MGPIYIELLIFGGSIVGRKNYSLFLEICYRLEAKLAFFKVILIKLVASLKVNNFMNLLSSNNLPLQL